MMLRYRIRDSAVAVADAAAPFLRVHRKLVGPVVSTPTLDEALRTLTPRVPPPPGEVTPAVVHAGETVLAIGMYALGLSARGALAAPAGHGDPRFAIAIEEGFVRGGYASPDELPGDPELRDACVALNRQLRAARTALRLDAPDDREPPA